MTQIHVLLCCCKCGQLELDNVVDAPDKPCHDEKHCIHTLGFVQSKKLTLAIVEARKEHMKLCKQLHDGYARMLVK